MPKINIEQLRKEAGQRKNAIETSRSVSKELPEWSVDHFGLCGVSADCDQMEIIEDCLALRRLKTRPSMIDVYRASNTIDAEAIEVGRWIDRTTFELVIADLDSKQKTLELAFHAATAVAIVSGVYATLPFYSDVSVDSILCSEESSVNFRPLFAAERFGPSLLGREISVQDTTEIGDCLTALWRFQRTDGCLRIKLACELLFSWSQSRNDRIALTGVWSGIDAIMGRNEHQSKRKLAERISSYLDGFSEDDVIEIYEIRCDAVHGRHCSSERILEGILRSEFLLRSLIAQVCRVGKQPLRDEGP